MFITAKGSLISSVSREIKVASTVVVAMGEHRCAGRGGDVQIGELEAECRRRVQDIGELPAGFQNRSC